MLEVAWPLAPNPPVTDWLWVNVDHAKNVVTVTPEEGDASVEGFGPCVGQVSKVNERAREFANRWGYAVVPW